MENTLFYHGKTLDNKRFTIAGKIKTDGDLILGLSLCSEHDQFVKKVGRAKAEGRAKARYPRGKVTTSFYSHSFYKRPTIKNWFVGKETEAFLERVVQFNTNNSTKLMKRFGLYSR